MIGLTDEQFDAYMKQAGLPDLAALKEIYKYVNYVGALRHPDKPDNRTIEEYNWDFRMFAAGYLLGKLGITKEDLIGLAIQTGLIKVVEAKEEEEKEEPKDEGV